MKHSKHQKDKAMAPHSSTLAWKIPWTEEHGGLQSMGSLRVRHYWATHFHFSLSCIGEGNGNPLQCSCLENPRDRGACWAAVYGVTQSDMTEATWQQQRNPKNVMSTGPSWTAKESEGGEPQCLRWKSFRPIAGEWGHFRPSSLVKMANNCGFKPQSFDLLCSNR